jgi:hypothetical protein
MDAPQPLRSTYHMLHGCGLVKLEDSTAETVNKHLEACPGFRRRVAELTSDSFLVPAMEFVNGSTSPGWSRPTTAAGGQWL